MNRKRYFKLVCTPESQDWYIQEYLAGRVRFGWSGPGSNLREIEKKGANCSDEQRVTWAYTKFLLKRIEPGDRVVVQTERPIKRFLVAEVVPPGYDYARATYPTSTTSCTPVLLPRLQFR